MSQRTPVERAGAQVGTDDAGTPGLWTLLAGLLGGAVAWSLHLLASYALVALACSTAWEGGRVAVLMVSGVALGAATAAGWLARRRWRIARAVDRPDDDAWDARMGERTARVSFLMMVGLVSAIVFAIGIVYQAAIIWMVPLCGAGTTG